MTTYVINPITNELESAQPKQTVGDKFKLQTFVRDRFALGGGVIQGEKVGDRENFAKPEIATSRIDQREDGTFAVRTKYKSTPSLLPPDTYSTSPVLISKTGCGVSTSA